MPYNMRTRGDTDYQTLATTQTKYLKVFSGGMLFLPIAFAAKGNGGGKNMNRYSFTMEMMLEKMPVKAQALFNTAIYNEHPAKVYIRADGKIGVGNQYGDNLTGSKDSSSGGKITSNKWHIITVTVDTKERSLIIYVDGQLVNLVKAEDLLVKDGDYSVSERVCLFGSQVVAECQGGNIKFFLFEDKILEPNEVLAFYETLKAERQWKCSVCTLCNPEDATTCSLCGNPNIAVAEASGWNCTACTFKNTGGTACSICGTPKPN